MSLNRAMRRRLERERSKHVFSRDELKERGFPMCPNCGDAVAEMVLFGWMADGRSHRICERCGWKDDVVTSADSGLVE